MNKEDIKELPSKIKTVIVNFLTKIIQILLNIYVKIVPKKIRDKIYIIIEKIKLYAKKAFLFILPETISKNENSKKRLKRLFIYSGALFLVQIIVVIIVVFFAVKTGGKSFIMPNVVGLEMFEAFDRVQKEKMNLNIEARLFDDAKLGTVIIQEPRAGTKIKRGRTVSLVVNAVPESIIFMPSVKGKTYEEAMKIITNTVLSKAPNIKILPPKENYEAKQKLDIVINQIPFENEEITENTEIMLVINKQPKEHSIKIPNFIGMDINAALKTFEGYNINIEVQNKETDDNNLIGKVIEQSIGAGTYTVNSLAGIILKVASSALENTKTLKFIYSVPTDRVEETTLKIVLDDNNGRRELYNKKVIAAENISFNYALSGKGIITLFYDDTPFETRNVE